jgi:hypothetical protein
MKTKNNIDKTKKEYNTGRRKDNEGKRKTKRTAGIPPNHNQTNG